MKRYQAQTNKIICCCFGTFLLFFSLVFPPLSAKIIKTECFRDILDEVNDQTLLLVDIDDTLIDSPYQVGSRKWRLYLRSQAHDYPVNEGINIHDLLSLFVAKTLAFETTEKDVARIIRDLQERDILVLGLTARGTSQWYSTDLPGIGDLTTSQVNYVGVDFTLVPLPVNLHNLDPQFYHQGILFSSHIKKGQFLVELLKSRDYFPEKIVVIDDKLSNLESLATELGNLGIDFVGYWYHGAEQRHLDFDPLVSTMELEALFRNVDLLDEESAVEAASKLREAGIDSDSYLLYASMYLFSLLDEIDFDAMFNQYGGK